MHAQKLVNGRLVECTLFFANATDRRLILESKIEWTPRLMNAFFKLMWSTYALDLLPGRYILDSRRAVHEVVLILKHTYRDHLLPERAIKSGDAITALNFYVLHFALGLGLLFLELLLAVRGCMGNTGTPRTCASDS